MILQGANTGLNTFSENLTDNPNGGSLSVFKSGAGTWILSGNDSYSGGSTVSGGNLLVNVASGTGISDVYATGGTATVNASSGVTANLWITGGAGVINSGYGVLGNLTMARRGVRQRRLRPRR